jgi:hypothetical protein
MLTWLGLVNPKSAVTLVAGVQAMAIFMDAANGAAYSLVPHVNPQYNGIMSGAVGSTGNFGGVLFSVCVSLTSIFVDYGTTSPSDKSTPFPDIVSIYQLPQGNLDHGCLQYGHRNRHDPDPSYSQVANEGGRLHESRMLFCSFDVTGCIITICRGPVG